MLNCNTNPLWHSARTVSFYLPAQIDAFHCMFESVSPSKYSIHTLHPCKVRDCECWFITSLCPDLLPFDNDSFVTRSNFQIKTKFISEKASCKKSSNTTVRTSIVREAVGQWDGVNPRVQVPWPEGSCGWPWNGGVWLAGGSQLRRTAD